MTRESPPAECREVRELLDAYLDGELDAEVAARVRRHLEAEPVPAAGSAARPGCAACRHELRRAERLREELRGLPVVPCPDAVTRRVLAGAREDAAPGGRRGRVFVFRRPAAAGAAARLMRLGALAAAAATLLWLGVRALEPPKMEPVAVQADAYTAYTPEELERAEQELRLALGYVAAIGRRSGVALRDDVLVGEVLEPSADALERAFGVGLDAGSER
jgi:anti-sigma factor RsiW